jgi:hypothetical protein
MTEFKMGETATPRTTKYLWFGFGNYGAYPNLQVGGGFVRDPSLLAKLFKKAGLEDSPMTCFMYIAAGLVSLTALLMLLAWGLSLLIE